MITIKEALQIAPNLDHLDRQVLLAHVLKSERSHLIAHSERSLSDYEHKYYLQLIARREQNEPVAYLAGYKEFYGRNFIVNEHTLIPRPETELIIDQLKDLYKEEAELTILDIGTGTGCLAITAALEFPNAQVVALEIDPNTAEVARANNALLSPQKLIPVIKSDLLTELPTNSSFDCIIANLPYISEQSAEVGTETSQYEPTQALYSGQNGLHHYRLLFTQLAARNLPFKHLICEIGFDQKESINTLAKKILGKEGIVYNDLADLPRIFVLTN